MQQFSIAEARNHLAAIVHDLDTRPFVQLTRRGKPVAVLLAIEEYERLAAGRSGFWANYEAFRATADLTQLEIDPALFAGSRDPAPGREMTW